MLCVLSLDNFSDKIRWSLDLRWQDANKTVGFFGLKDGVRMRSSTDPNFKIDWEQFDAVSRHEKQFESMNTASSAKPSTLARSLFLCVLYTTQNIYIYIYIYKYI